MSKKLEITTVFNVNRSALLIKALIILHLLAVTAVFLNSLPSIYKFCLITAIIISLTSYIIQALRTHHSKIRYSSIVGWGITQNGDVFHPIEILPSTVLTSYLSILHFKTHNKKIQTILIVKDALTHDNYRKLMVLLKIAGAKKIK